MCDSNSYVNIRETKIKVPNHNGLLRSHHSTTLLHVTLAEWPYLNYIIATPIHANNHT